MREHTGNREMSDPADADGDPNAQDADVALFSTLDPPAREAAQRLLSELDEVLARMLKKRCAFPPRDAD